MGKNERGGGTEAGKKRIAQHTPPSGGSQGGGVAAPLHAGVKLNFPDAAEKLRGFGVKLGIW